MDVGGHYPLSSSGTGGAQGRIAGLVSIAAPQNVTCLNDVAMCDLGTASLAPSGADAELEELCSALPGWHQHQANHGLTHVPGIIGGLARTASAPSAFLLSATRKSLSPGYAGGAGHNCISTAPQQGNQAGGVASIAEDFTTGDRLPGPALWLQQSQALSSAPCNAQFLGEHSVSGSPTVFGAPDSQPNDVKSWAGPGSLNWSTLLPPGEQHTSAMLRSLYSNQLKATETSGEVGFLSIKQATSRLRQVQPEVLGGGGGKWLSASHPHIPQQHNPAADALSVPLMSVASPSQPLPQLLSGSSERPGGGQGLAAAAAPGNNSPPIATLGLPGVPARRPLSSHSLPKRPLSGGSEHLQAAAPDIKGPADCGMADSQRFGGGDDMEAGEPQGDADAGAPLDMEQDGAVRTRHSASSGSSMCATANAAPACTLFGGSETLRRVEAAAVHPAGGQPPLTPALALGEKLLEHDMAVGLVDPLGVALTVSAAAPHTGSPSLRLPGGCSGGGDGAGGDGVGGGGSKRPAAGGKTGSAPAPSGSRSNSGGAPFLESGPTGDGLQLLAMRFRNRPGRVPKAVAKLGPIAELAKNAATGRIKLEKEELEDLVTTVETSLAKAVTEQKEDSRARNRVAQQRFRNRQRETIAALQSKVEEQEVLISALHEKIKMYEQLLQQQQQQEMGCTPTGAGAPPRQSGAGGRAARTSRRAGSE